MPTQIKKKHGFNSVHTLHSPRWVEGIGKRGKLKVQNLLNMHVYIIYYIIINKKNKKLPDLTHYEICLIITEIISIVKGVNNNYALLSWYKNFRIPWTRTWIIRKKHKMYILIIIRQIKYVSVLYIINNDRS